MKIKLINPNTTQSMTDSIYNMAVRYADADTEITAVSPLTGPDSIECYVDEYLAVPGVIQEVIKGDKEENADAFIIACFGDPGLATAKFIAPYFSVVSVLDRSRKVTEDVVKAYGAESFCRSIRTTGLSVLEFGKNPEKGLKALAEQGRRAVEEDGAECILLGCAGFVDVVDRLREELGVPVLDGVMPAVKLAEALVKMNVKTSKANTWKAPEVKEIKGFNGIVDL